MNLWPIGHRVKVTEEKLLEELSYANFNFLGSAKDINLHNNTVLKGYYQPVNR